MKRIACLLLCGVLLTMLSACGGSEPSPAETETPAESITFTDDLGREVTLAKPSRVAALIGSFADVWCLAGGQDTLVATANDSWTQFDLDLPETVKNLGTTTEPNVELLRAAEPDFVIGSTKTEADLELQDLLEQSGIPVAYFNVSSFGDYLRMLEICTQLTGCPENYEEYGTKVQAQIDQAKTRPDGSEPSVLYVRHRCADRGGAGDSPTGGLCPSCPLCPGHRLQLQGEKQPGQRAGRNAGGPGLRQHSGQREQPAGEP